MDKMSFEEFTDWVKENIGERLDYDNQDKDIVVSEMRKPGATYTGMSIKGEHGQARPVANLDMLYEDYQGGTSIDTILDRVADIMQMDPPSQDMSWILDYEKVRSHLFIRVNNAETNGQLVENAPHIIKEDLVITCHIKVDSIPNGLASTTVTNDLLQHFGVTEEQILRDAFESTKEVMPVKVMSMREVMKEIMGGTPFMDDMPFDPPMTIVTNEVKTNGAAAIFYDGVMDKLAADMGSDLIILPSSVSEMIIVPARAGDDIKELEAMVQSINGECVEPEQRLSDHVYHYDAKDRVFERLDTYQARKAEKDKAAERSSVLKKLEAKKVEASQMAKDKTTPHKVRTSEQSL